MAAFIVAYNSGVASANRVVARMIENLPSKRVTPSSCAVLASSADCIYDHLEKSKGRRGEMFVLPVTADVHATMPSNVREWLAMNS